MPPKKGQRVEFSETVKKMVRLECGNACCFKGCDRQLTKYDPRSGKTVLVGGVGHILGASLAGPRRDPSMSEADIKNPQNAIPFCSDHHTIVDQIYEEYPPEELREWKRETIAKAKQMTMSKAFSGTPDALVEIMKWLLDEAEASQVVQRDLNTIEIGEKIQKNKLSFRVITALNSGWHFVPSLEYYFSHSGSLYPERFDKLTAFFRSKYHEFAEVNSAGDAIWDAFVMYMTSHFVDCRFQLPVHGVLTYMFHICEIMEK